MNIRLREGISRRELFLSVLLLPVAWLALGKKSKDRRRNLAELLKSGKVIVLTINSSPKGWGERYSDWSEYLNAFAAQNQSSFEFVRVDTSELASMIKNSSQFTEPYSMLFMKDGRETLFYPGCIVEPQVYEYVQLFYSGKPMPKELKQFAPKRVEIQLVR